MENDELLRLVEGWCIRNMPFEGKMKMIGVIAEDLGLPTFEIRIAGWNRGYPHNNEIGACLNILAQQGKLYVNKNGRAHIISYQKV